MSEISRRALFGMGAGAVAAKVMPKPEPRAETYGLDFGRRPAMIRFSNGWTIDMSDKLPTIHDHSEFTHVEAGV